jgi:hypothetical protein
MYSLSGCCLTRFRNEGVTGSSPVSGTTSGLKKPHLPFRHLYRSFCWNPPNFRGLQPDSGTRALDLDGPLAVEKAE